MSRSERTLARRLGGGGGDDHYPRAVHYDWKARFEYAAATVTLCLRDALLLVQLLPTSELADGDEG